jgi:hypothetical protein
MPISTTVPIRISPEAAAHVADLGMRLELDRMLEHTCQTWEVQSLEVTLIPPCDPGEDARVVLEVTRATPREASDPFWSEWRDWMLDTFSPEILRHFNMLTVYGAANEG